MARNPLLTDEVAEILLTRIALSQTLGSFSLRELGDGWEISIATLHRYKSPAYRESSREYSKKAYLSYRKSLHRGVCYRCHDDLNDHARCGDCEILLHQGSRFGHSEDGKTCSDCIDSRNRKTMRLYGES